MYDEYLKLFFHATTIKIAEISNIAPLSIEHHPKNSVIIY